jgi:hypothetical protein
MARSWKAVERAIAKELGGVRVPITGRQRGDVPDVSHPDLGLEVKAWRHLPARVNEAMEQAEAASRNGQLPLAVIHEDHRGYGRSLAVMRLSEFQARFMVGGRLRRG